MSLPDNDQDLKKNTKQTNSAYYKNIPSYNDDMTPFLFYIPVIVTLEDTQLQMQQIL